MSDDAGGDRGRCGAHQLALGPDGLCVLCRRTASRGEAAVPSSARAGWILGLGVAAVLLVAVVAQARRSAAVAAPTAQSEEPVAADTSPVEPERPARVDRTLSTFPEPPRPLQTAAAAPAPVAAAAPGAKSSLDEALAAAKRVDAETAPVAASSIEQRPCTKHGHDCAEIKADRPAHRRVAGYPIRRVPGAVPGAVVAP